MGAGEAGQTHAIQASPPLPLTSAVLVLYSSCVKQVCYMEVSTVKRFFGIYRSTTAKSMIPREIEFNDKKKTSISFSKSLAKEIKRRGMDEDLDFSEALHAAAKFWLASHTAIGSKVETPLTLAEDWALIEASDHVAAEGIRRLISMAARGLDVQQPAADAQSATETLRRAASEVAETLEGPKSRGGGRDKSGRGAA